MSTDMTVRKESIGTGTVTQMDAGIIFVHEEILTSVSGGCIRFVENAVDQQNMVGGFFDFVSDNSLRIGNAVGGGIGLVNPK